eukprot:2590833-Rhodomonas_salina.1
MRKHECNVQIEFYAARHDDSTPRIKTEIQASVETNETHTMGSGGAKLAKNTVTEEERAAFASKTVLVTGANSGVGLDCCKQLAESGWGRIILACRNKGRGEEAIKSLEKRTGKQVFELVILDTENLDQCRDVARSLSGKLDCIVLNAGKMLPQAEALKASYGFSTNAAMHVLGPVAFTDALLSEGKLSGNGTVLYVSSEAARGIKAFGVAPPVVPETKEDLEKLVKGEARALPTGKWDDLAEYGMMKLLGALHFSALAKKHPQLHIFSVSPGLSTSHLLSFFWIMHMLTLGLEVPGSTRGANTVSEHGIVAQYLAPVMMFMVSAFGLSLPLEHGSDRYVQLANRPSSFQ